MPNEPLSSAKEIISPSLNVFHRTLSSSVLSEYGAPFCVSPRGAINFIRRKEYISTIIFYTLTFRTCNTRAQQWIKDTRKRKKWKWARVSVPAAHVHFRSFFAIFGCSHNGSSLSAYFATTPAFMFRCRNEFHIAGRRKRSTNEQTTGNRIRLGVTAMIRFLWQP